MKRRNGRTAHDLGGNAGWRRDLERTIAALEASLDPLFAAGRYRDFFDRAHAIRRQLATGALPQAARTGLWERLNRIVETAKARQEREFAARREENLARWRASLVKAEHYTGALHAEIGELSARRSAPVERARWERRIAEKQARLAEVEATIAELRRKIRDVEGSR